MRVPRPQPWGLCLLLVLLPRTLRADGHRSLLYRLTAVSSPAPGSPAFWATGWLGPQQYLRYSDLRGQAEPFGAWIWESQLPWYWEKETADLRVKQALFLEAFTVLEEGGSYILQGLLGCEMGPDNSTSAVATFALNGEEFMKFDPKAGNWDGDWPEARAISQKWKQHEDAVWQEGHFLLTSCPQRLLGHLETGRSNLEWKAALPAERAGRGRRGQQLRPQRRRLLPRLVHAGRPERRRAPLPLRRAARGAAAAPRRGPGFVSQVHGASGWNRHRLLTAHGSGCRRSCAVVEDEEGPTSPLDPSSWGRPWCPPAHWAKQGC
uniref:Fc of IgG receptor and transporter n=1 Tax=Myotis myotis TaxID=51298 RepID=A0A7J7QXF0_MYOMY|nr:Fc fragment of IgG receptor and transporter [Myotis myotis]